MKRVEARAPTERDEETGRKELGESIECKDSRNGGGLYYLPEEEVDKWDVSRFRREDKAGWDVDENGEDKSPCEDKWKNIKEAHTAKVWGVFKVQGWFVLLCRHSFVMKVADMIRSGEKAKYFLSLVHCLLLAMKKDRKSRGEEKPQGKIGIGYDLGCKSFHTIWRSPLNTLALSEELLSFLLNYVLGAGNENLKTCERFFSQSNTLATVTRHASRFHRKQAITEWLYYHDNLETYASLSKFIYTNYKTALKTLQLLPEVLRRMQDHHITDVGIFKTWLDEEMVYLQSRINGKPQHLETDILSVEYIGARMALSESQDKVLEIQKAQRSCWVDDSAGQQKICWQLRYAEAKKEKYLKEVERLEELLNIVSPWVVGSKEWENALVTQMEMEYREALERLEGLVVAQLFELAKVNKAGTGYKLRELIVNTLQTQSQAIKTALEHYNKAAACFKPPHRKLKWKNILEYMFLNEFEILMDTKGEITEKPWAKLANR
uniref:Uncharacterized protein n=1 Tax=Moniliophthora roreri TaxID=221103 RepID=A0A0W0FVZ3_MONRR